MDSTKVVFVRNMKLESITLYFPSPWYRFDRKNNLPVFQYVLVSS